MGRVTTRRPVLRVSGTGVSQRPDTLAVEEPLEIRLDGQALTVTMRTPGDDVELAHGFLLSEGLIAHPDDVVSARFCAGADEEGTNSYNVLDVTLRSPVDISGARNFLTTSACGVCGNTSLDQLRTESHHRIAPNGVGVDGGVLTQLPRTLRTLQRVFDTTGGLHAAGLFTADGTPLAVREDVGRHNAVDKIIGWALINNRIPAHDRILIVSGRASFELAQKATMAAIPILGAVSAPSSLAVDLAAEAGLTLAGFLRGDSMNIYTHPHRIRVSHGGDRGGECPTRDAPDMGGG